MKVEKMAKNGEMVQNCYPLSPMRTPKVTKKFRFLYNKGVVHDDGTITSFYN